MDFKIFIPPLVGGIIGYITNYIAIKMLFHPRKAIYFLNHKLPFTPGLIPKEKERVAKAVGKTVSGRLLDAETLQNAFTSEEMTAKLKNGMESLINRNRSNEKKVKDIISDLAFEGTADSIISNVRNDAVEIIHRKLTELEFGKSISKKVINKVKERVDSYTFGILSNIADDNFLDGIAKSIGDVIDRAIADNSREIIGDLVDNETDRIMEYKICDLIDRYEEKIPAVIGIVLSIYKKTVTENLNRILQEIDIAKIVEDKIASFDVIELENIILELMKRELNAIVYLGALLGFIMGWANLLIMKI